MNQAPFRSTTLGRKYCIEGVPQNIINPQTISHYSSIVSDIIKKPIFVIGSPRSGTTVLGKTLGLHNQVACGDESLYLLELFRMFYNLYHGERPNASTPLKQYVEGDNLIYLQQQLAEAIFAGKLGNKAIYLDQTPWYGPIGSYINLLFGDARFIHIIRNGNDVVKSLGQSYDHLRYQWAGRNISERTRIWTNMVMSAQELKKFGSNRYLEIRYEDFISKPTKILKLICDFIGIDFQRDMLRGLSVDHTIFTGNSKAVNHFNIQDQKQGELRTKTMDNYPEDFISGGGKLMQSLGYM